MKPESCCGSRENRPLNAPEQHLNIPLKWENREPSQISQQFWATPFSDCILINLPSLCPAERDACEALRLSVGSAIAQCRKCQGLTQMQLAERAAVDQAVVSRIERGRANPTLDLIADLATALGVEPKMIMVGREGGVAEALPEC